MRKHREGKRHTLIIVAEGAGKASDIASLIKKKVGTGMSGYRFSDIFKGADLLPQWTEYLRLNLGKKP